jgi:hypothetical protein
MRFTRYFAPAALAAVSLLGLAALAQPPQPQQQDDAYDPESANRSVARISVMNGDVSVRRGDNGDFVAAALNAPLVVGDRILTGPNSRAEVQFDWANMIRLAPDTEVRLAELGDRHYQIQLARGLATFRVLRASEADVEVSTPQVSIRPKNQGVYRLLVRDDGQSEVTARSGDVEIFTPRGVETLHAGQTMQVRGTASDPEFQIVAAYGEDEWDRWNRSRDQSLERAASPRYVNRDVYGTEDLDGYGQWVQDPSYGAVWAPRVAAGWAPYREGRWVWVDYYGWTWVSYDPWGWAPYHYGRWYQSSLYGWCWYPGAIGFGYRHYWSPGLVAFVGFGRGGAGFGHIGWVPLAPHERYHPWYGRGYGGRGNVNIVTNVNIYNNYRNARINNAVTAVDGSGFARGARGRAFSGDIRQASVVQGRLPVAPSRESMRLSDRAVRQSSLTRSTDNQRFFSSQQAVQAGGGRSLGQSTVQPRVSGPGFNQASQNPGAGGGQGLQRGQSSQGTWRRFGEPNGNGSAARTEPRNNTSPSTGGGWGRFGAPNGNPSAAGRGYSSPEPRGNASPSSERGAWGRFGDPGTRNSQSQHYRSAPDSSGGRQRLESRPPAVSAPQYQAPPRYNGGSNQNRYSPPANIDRGNSYRGGGSHEPVRISPPMVRERSAPARSESRPSGGNSGGSRGDSGGSRGHSDSRGGRNR